jgi:hypothetical protein
MQKNTYLMPGSLRFVGIIFFVIGCLFGLARFYFGIKPEFLEIKVFAVFSSYFQTKYMELISNNMIEELTGFFMLSGLFLIAFSREREESRHMDEIRLRSFFISAYLNFLFLILSLFLTFGFAFVYVLFLNMLFGLSAYIVTFRILLLRNKSKIPLS